MACAISADVCLESSRSRAHPAHPENFPQHIHRKLCGGRYVALS